MKSYIQNYSDAIQANIDATKIYFDAGVAKRKAYYALLKAKEEMHAMEKQIMQDGELRNEFEEIFEKDQEAIDGIRPSKSNRSGEIFYHAKIQQYLTKLIESFYD